MFKIKKQGAVDILTGDEILNEETVDEIASVIDDCMNQGQPQIIFDLKKIPLINSKGLEFLLDTQDLCTRKGGAFKLAAPNALCNDILKITGIVEQFELFDDAISAAGSFVQ